MPRRLPQLNALKAFEAAARHISFTRAAEELCVTQGAVSHQVKALEAELGIKLFNRERQQLIITDAGRDYLAVVRDALDRIAMGTERLVQRQSSGMLTVSTSPDFAAKWLVHRLGRFAEAHPAIDLRGGRVVQLRQGDYARETVYGDDPVAVARWFADAGAAWVHVVDLDAARDGGHANLRAIEEICVAVDCKVQTGGGIRSVDDATERFAAGVTRVVVGSAAVERPELVDELATMNPGTYISGWPICAIAWLEIQSTTTSCWRQCISVPRS